MAVVTAPAEDRPLLEVDDVSLSFAGIRALQSVSFEVNGHELFAIIGPNGAGKTSLFNCLSGLYRAQRGSIRFLGRELIGLNPDRIAKAGIARTFQNVELFENLTVLDNLMLGRHVHVGYGIPAALLWLGRARREEVRHRRVIEDIVDFLEIEPYRKLPVGVLPFGIKKRVELGRALAMEPRLLLLDEPVSGMNVEETEDMARFVLDIREELGLAMILVEHDMGVVMDLADRVLALDFGIPIAVGPPAVIQHHPDVIRAYLGEQHGMAPSAAAKEAAATESGLGGTP
ncbi:MAG TPA: ABC transporter ATP-binding protein [Actinomycetes bacterium]|jgi:branched-chain amino acid transport system ATP-binding protein|nr:ABC transporter ATP-binding protein [Actinomycetes bacterium]